MIITIFSDELPLTCGGFARKNEDDTYTIVLNPKHSYHQQRATYIHELEHIMNQDHDRDCHVNLIEAARHTISNY